MEREWPSVKNCPQYKYGMIQPYLVKYEWEDKGHIDDSAYYDSSDEEGDRRVNTHQVVKKFLQQVRDSRGYDVDCMPPVRFGSPFRKVDLECELEEDESFAEEVNEAIELAIERINKKNGKPYELVDVLKVVETTNLMLLLTFTAREVGSAAAETFIAMVYVPVPDGDFQLLECMLRPEDAAPTDV